MYLVKAELSKLRSVRVDWIVSDVVYGRQLCYNLHTCAVMIDTYLKDVAWRVIESWRLDT